jgi:hypothetical protein
LLGPMIRCSVIDIEEFISAMATVKEVKVLTPSRALYISPTVCVRVCVCVRARVFRLPF